MEQALEPETFVAAARTDRRFSIAINNYAAIIVAAPLVAAVSAAAPRGYPISPRESSSASQTCWPRWAGASPKR